MKKKCLTHYLDEEAPLQTKRALTLQAIPTMKKFPTDFFILNSLMQFTDDLVEAVQRDHLTREDLSSLARLELNSWARHNHAS